MMHLHLKPPTWTWTCVLICAMGLLACKQPRRPVVAPATTPKSPPASTRSAATKAAVTRPSQLKNARQHLSTILLAIQIHRGRKAALPENLKVLTEGTKPILAPTMLQDPWGHEVVYRKSDKGFVLLLVGPDGKEGTADDVRPPMLKR